MNAWQKSLYTTPAKIVKGHLTGALTSQVAADALGITTTDLDDVVNTHYYKTSEQIAEIIESV